MPEPLQFKNEDQSELDENSEPDFRSERTKESSPPQSTLGFHSDVTKDFDVLKPLGQGGFGKTYLAIERKTGKQCVLKEVRIQAGFEAKTLELVEREAIVLSKLDHPGIPAFKNSFEVATANGLILYLVQEYVEGENIKNFMKNHGVFTEDEVLTMAKEISEILAYLHGRRPPIIHRDIKPSNLMLTPNGDVFLIDFGSVRDKALRDQDTFGGGSTFVGTYGYIPYEQYSGRALPASDFYALGMSMIYMLSGREPMDLKEDGMRRRFREHVSISETTAQIIERLIEPDWRDRYSSPYALHADLDNALHEDLAPQIDATSKHTQHQYRNENIKTSNARSAHLTKHPDGDPAPTNDTVNLGSQPHQLNEEVFTTTIEDNRSKMSYLFGRQVGTLYNKIFGQLDEMQSTSITMITIFIIAFFILIWLSKN